MKLEYRFVSFASANFARAKEQQTTPGQGNLKLNKPSTVGAILDEEPYL